MEGQPSVQNVGSRSSERARVGLAGGPTDGGTGVEEVKTEWFRTGSFGVRSSDCGVWNGGGREGQQPRIGRIARIGVRKAEAKRTTTEYTEGIPQMRGGRSLPDRKATELDSN